MKNLPKLNSKHLAYTFLSIVMLTGIYSTYLVISASNAPLSIPVDDKNTTSGYFNPYRNQEVKKVSVVGEISKSQDSEYPSEYPYVLLNDSKKVAYLYSETNDLNLSLGLNLQIDGEVMTLKDGVDVINVKSIKLK